MSRKVCVVVSARPSFSRVRTVLGELHRRNDVELHIVLAASALLDRYGSVETQLEADGIGVSARISSVIEGEDLISMPKTTGLTMIELATTFAALKPDVVVTIADRHETLATAVAASYMNIPLAHLLGGEVTGSIDEKVRHAVTKLADIHFVATARSGERVVRMGEDPGRVHITGCPSVDIAVDVLNHPAMDFDPYERYVGVGTRPDLAGGYIVVLQHPVTTEYASASNQVNETLAALEAIPLPKLWFWPNVDAGSDGTSDALRTFRERKPNAGAHFFKSMASSDFLRLLRNSKCIVGNSSVGVRECSFHGVPAVDIGNRQFGRELGSNVIRTAYDRGEIRAAVLRHISNGRLPGDNLYGDGTAGHKIAELLAKEPLTFEKHFCN